MPAICVFHILQLDFPKKSLYNKDVQRRPCDERSYTQFFIYFREDNLCASIILIFRRFSALYRRFSRDAAAEAAISVNKRHPTSGPRDIAKTYAA